jgi:hypothetical protein
MLKISKQTLQALVALETKQVIRELVEKKKKKSCTSRKDGKGHAVAHSKKDGQFVSQDNTSEIGSYSVRDPQSSDCRDAGQAKAGSGKQRLFTKIKCARKDRKNPNSHTGIRCNDGAKVNEEGMVLAAPPANLNISDAESNNTGKNIDFDVRWKMFVNQSTSEEINRLKQHLCKGKYSMETLLKLQNQTALASKGELDKPTK